MNTPFLDILNKIEEVTRGHPNYVSSKNRPYKNFFNFVISAENNTDMHIDLAVLVFYISPWFKIFRITIFIVNMIIKVLR